MSSWVGPQLIRLWTPRHCPRPGRHQNEVSLLNQKRTRKPLQSSAEHPETWGTSQLIPVILCHLPLLGAPHHAGTWKALCKYL